MKQLSKLFCLLLACHLLTSCTPQKRLDRLLRKHPYLQKNDSVRGFVIDSTKAISVSVTAPVDTTLAYLDSLISEYDNQRINTFYKLYTDSLRIKALNDSLNKALRAQAKNYIINKPILKDTVVKTEGDVTVKVFSRGNDIGITIYRPAVVKKIAVTTSVNSVNASPCKDPWWALPSLIGLCICLILIVFYLLKKNFKP